MGSSKTKLRKILNTQGWIKRNHKTKNTTSQFPCATAEIAVEFLESTVAKIVTSSLLVDIRESLVRVRKPGSGFKLYRSVSTILHDY